MAELKTNVELAKFDVVAGTPISVDISVFTEGQVKVYLTDSRVLAVNLTDYTISMLGGSTSLRDGFRLTPTASMLTKIAATGNPNKIYIRRSTELTTEFSETDSFLRDRIVDEFDKTIMRMQELSSDVTTAVRTPTGEAAIILPSAVTRAGKLLEFDADGKPITTNSAATILAGSAQVAIDRVAVAADREAVAADKASVDASVTAAANSAGAAANSANDASDERLLAQGARTDAQTAAGQAQTAQSGAQTARTGAETARTGAETAQGAAQTARTGAETAQGASETARDASVAAKDLSVAARTGAETAKTATDVNLAAVRALYQGALSADPTTDLGGVALTNKAYYYNTTGLKFRFYNGASWQDNPVTATGAISEIGQCKLKYVSATSLRLDPCDGNKIMIGGIPRTIPNAGVTISNGGLASSNLYYIYASWSGSAVTLSASSTVPVRDASTGVVIKTGDANSTLVGMAYTNGSSQFVDTAVARFVRSYFNEQSVNLSNYNSANTPNSGTSFNEILSALRLQVLTWPGEEITGMCSASVTSDTVGAAVRLGVGFNVANNSVSLSLVQVPTAGFYNNLTVMVAEKASAGAANVQFFAPVCFQSAGVGQFAHVQQRYSTTRANSF